MVDTVDRLIATYGAEEMCAKLIPYLSSVRLERIEHVLDARIARLTVIVEDTYDPRNAVAAIRTCEAFGLTSVHAIAGADPFRLAPGVTRGCHRWMDIVRWSSAKGCVDALHAQGVAVYATAPSATHELQTVPLDRPVAIAFGNEHAGISPELVAACEGTVRIPMYGFTESFNLSVSVALALHTLTGRVRASGGLGDLTAEQRMRLRARWIALKVRGVEEVMERIGTKLPVR